MNNTRLVYSTETVPPWARIAAGCRTTRKGKS